MPFSRYITSDEYMKLLTLYRYGGRESVYRAKPCVERHFAFIWCEGACVCACVLAFLVFFFLCYCVCRSHY